VKDNHAVEMLMMVRKFIAWKNEEKFANGKKKRLDLKFAPRYRLTIIS